MAFPFVVLIVPRVFLISGWNEEISLHVGGNAIFHTLFKERYVFLGSTGRVVELNIAWPPPCYRIHFLNWKP